MPRGGQGGGEFEIIRVKTISSDAFIKIADITETITSDAYIKATVDETITSDAYIKATSEETITSDAFVKRPGEEGTIISDAMIKRGDEISPYYGGVPITRTNTNPYDLQNLGGTQFTGTAPESGVMTQIDLRCAYLTTPATLRLKIVVGGKEYLSNETSSLNPFMTLTKFTFNQARIEKSQAITVQLITGVPFNLLTEASSSGDNSGFNWVGTMPYITYTLDDIKSDAVIKEAVPQVVFTFDYIQHSDAFIREIQEETITSDMFIDFLHFDVSITSDAFIKATSEETLTSDAFIKVLNNTETITSDAWIEEVQEETITSDAYILAGQDIGLTSDMYIKVLDNTETIDSMSYVEVADITGTIKSDSYIVRLSPGYKIYPVGNQDYNLSDPDERLRFKIPFSSDGYKVHIHIQVAADAGFTNVIGNFYSWQHEGRWTYWNGTDFVDWPSDGIAPADQWEEGRFRIQGLINPEDLISRGVWYWRIRGVTVNTYRSERVDIQSDAYIKKPDNTETINSNAEIQDSIIALSDSRVSLRKFFPGYTGSCLRIRRGLDNAEQDIGFSGDWVDEAAIISFCSGSIGYVTTWYDQSNNNIDFYQTDVNKQPKIYNGSSLYTSNGKTAIFFTKANQEHLRTADNAICRTVPYSIAGVRQWGGTNNSVLWAPTSTNSPEQLLQTTPRELWRAGSFIIGPGPTTSMQFTIGTMNTTSYFRVDNGSDLSGVIGVPDVIPINNGLTIGGGIDYYDGYVTEFIVWELDIHTQFDDVSDNLNSYYSIF